MSGFVVLHRSLLGHPAFRNDAEAMAFAWMILRASWRPVRVRYKGKAITPRGNSLFPLEIWPKQWTAIRRGLGLSSSPQKPQIANSKPSSGPSYNYRGL